MSCVLLCVTIVLQIASSLICMLFHIALFMYHCICRSLCRYASRSFFSPTRLCVSHMFCLLDRCFVVLVHCCLMYFVHSFINPLCRHVFLLHPCGIILLEFVCLICVSFVRPLDALESLATKQASEQASKPASQRASKPASRQPTSQPSTQSQNHCQSATRRRVALLPPGLSKRDASTRRALAPWALQARRVDASRLCPLGSPSATRRRVALWPPGLSKRDASTRRAFAPWAPQARRVDASRFCICLVVCVCVCVCCVSCLFRSVCCLGFVLCAWLVRCLPCLRWLAGLCVDKNA